MKLETSVQEDAVESANKHPLQICENVPLGILIRIMHASVGPTLNAQSKILGASLRYVEPLTTYMQLKKGKKKD